MEIASLDLSQEVPLKSLAGFADASENYAWCGYDLERNVGFFAHLGRWSLDRELWREQLYVYLPNRTVLAYRGFGRGDCSKGPAAGVQRQICVEAGKRWSLHHHGPILHLDPCELTRGPAQEPFVQRLEFDVDFHGDLVPFFYPRSDNTTWGNWHYEQGGSMSGRVKFGDAVYEIEGFAFRDHTRGPRNLSHFCGSNWIQGRLPDGTGFALFQTWHSNNRDNGNIATGLSELTLTTGDALESATLLEAPGLESLEDLNAAFRISFESSRGRIDIAAEPLNAMIFSASSRHEILLGAARATAPLVVAEQPLRLRIGNEIGVGHCERCRLVNGAKPSLRLE